jgi:hypothetical protein
VLAQVLGAVYRLNDASWQACAHELVIDAKPVLQAQAARLRLESLAEYERWTQQIVAGTAGVTASGSVVTAWCISQSAGLAFAAGGLLALAYQWSLGRAVDRIVSTGPRGCKNEQNIGDARQSSVSGKRSHIQPNLIARSMAIAAAAAGLLALTSAASGEHLPLLACRTRACLLLLVLRRCTNYEHLICRC